MIWTDRNANDIPPIPCGNGVYRHHVDQCSRSRGRPETGKRAMAMALLASGGHMAGAIVARLNGAA